MVLSKQDMAQVIRASGGCAYITERVRAIYELAGMKWA